MDFDLYPIAQEQDISYRVVVRLYSRRRLSQSPRLSARKHVVLDETWDFVLLQKAVGRDLSQLGAREVRVLLITSLKDVTILVNL